jgi:hypothetical protein
MSICEFCEQEMLDAAGCTLEEYTDLGPVPLKRIKYGESSAFPDMGRKRCHDCNVEVGNYHHPYCDYEECPGCHQQALSCDCLQEAD